MSRWAIIWCGAVNEHPPRLSVLDYRKRSAANLYRPTEFDTALHDIDLCTRAVIRRSVNERDIHAFIHQPDLLPSPFAGKREKAEIKALQTLAVELAKVATADDSLVFIAANHGKPGLGLMTSVRESSLDPLDAPATALPVYLTPEILRAALDPIPGRQILVIGACGAGAFAALGEDDRRLVLAGCDAGPDGRVMLAPFGDPPHTPFLSQVVGGWGGVSLDPGTNAEQLSLEEAYERALTNPLVASRNPCRRGSATWP